MHSSRAGNILIRKRSNHWIAIYTGNVARNGSPNPNKLAKVRVLAFSPKLSIKTVVSEMASLYPFCEIERVQ